MYVRLSKSTIDTVGNHLYKSTKTYLMSKTNVGFYYSVSLEIKIQITFTQAAMRSHVYVNMPSTLTKT